MLNGWFIFREGDEGEDLFFIKKGQVDIVGKNGQVIFTMQTGNFFGEIALIEGTPFLSLLLLSNWNRWKENGEFKSKWRCRIMYTQQERFQGTVSRKSEIG